MTHHDIPTGSQPAIDAAYERREFARLAAEEPIWTPRSAIIAWFLAAFGLGVLLPSATLLQPEIDREQAAIDWSLEYAMEEGR